MTYKLRFPIVLLTGLVIVLAGVASVMHVETAEKAPSFFPESHNLGLLEIVNNELVASKYANVDQSDQIDWGLIVPDGGGGGGGGGTPNPVFCPKDSLGRVCSDKGACNELAGQCICYSDHEGTDCSVKTEETPVLERGNLALAPTRYTVSTLSQTGEDSTALMTFTNDGEVDLNYYLYVRVSSDGTPTYLENDDSSVPNWLSFPDNSYSGVVPANSVETVVMTLSPENLPCPTSYSTCTGDFSMYFFHTGKDAGDVGDRIRVNFGRGTASPTDAPTASPTPAPTAEPTTAPTTSPTKAPTIPMCRNGEKNGGETDTDCGGRCPGCAFGQVCVAGSDCESENCDGGTCGAAPTAAPTPSPPTTSPTPSPTASNCMDNVKNGDETDVDCGGPNCPGCDSAESCSVNGDCISGNCSGANTCGDPTPSPTSSPTLSPTSSPTISPTSAPTTSSPTAAPTKVPTANSCSNGLTDNLETGVDCGGGYCRPCDTGDSDNCIVDTDCRSSTCLSGSCVEAPTAAPTSAPTDAPTAAPTTAAPTESPTSSPTSSPTLSPTARPTSAPTIAPTTADCNDAYCSFHGRCSEGICTCFPGFVGRICEEVETLEKSSQFSVDVYWGIKGVDRKDTSSEEYPSGKPVYNEMFDIGHPEAQIFLRDSCDFFR